MLNPYAVFLDLLPKRPRVVGEVVLVSENMATVVIEGGGGRIQAVGEAQVGQRVYVRDDLVEGLAPALTYVEGEA